jgi:hypothetical protein
MTTYFKSVFSFAVIAVSLFVFSSCQETEDPGPLQEVEKEYDVIDFDRVEIGDAFDVTIEEGNYFEITVRGDRRNLDDLIIRKEGETLVARYDNYRNRRHDTYITITMPLLMSANLSGATDSRISGFYGVDNFDLYLSGASECQLDVETNNLDIILSGASILNVRGEGQNLKAQISGASDLRAFNFPVREADINVSGASDARVTVADDLHAIATGASMVVYRGNPSVSADASGESSVRQE